MTLDPCSRITDRSYGRIGFELEQFIGTLHASIEGQETFLKRIERNIKNDNSACVITMLKGRMISHTRVANNKMNINTVSGSVDLQGHPLLLDKVDEVLTSKQEREATDLFSC